MTKSSLTRKQELELSIRTFLDVLHRHSHATIDIFFRVDFLDLKDIPAALITALSGEEPLLRNIRPKPLQLVDGEIVVSASSIPDGVATDFKLPWKVISNSESVFIHGLKQTRIVDYTMNAEYIYFKQPPPANSVILVDLSPLAPSPDPNSPKYVVSEIPLQQFNDLVYYTKLQADPNSLQIYKQGLRTTSGSANDYVVISRQRFQYNYPVLGSNILVDYQTATGGDDLYIRTDSFTTELANNLGQVSFTLTDDPILYTEQVYVSGLRKTRGIDYSVNDRVITITNPSLTTSATSVLVDYQTDDSQILTEYKTLAIWISTVTSQVVLEEFTTNTVLLNTPQVYVQGQRKELTQDYTIGGGRNQNINFNSVINNCWVVVDYQI